MFSRIFGSRISPPRMPSLDERLDWYQEQVNRLEQQLYQKQNTTIYTKDGHAINLESLIFDLAEKAGISIQVEGKGYPNAMSGSLQFQSRSLI